MATCQKCGFALPADKSFCTQCGTKAEKPAASLASILQLGVSTSTPCSNCGAAVPAGKRFCTKCGHALNVITPGVTPNQFNPPATIGGVTCVCGAAVPAGKRFCTSCGRHVSAKPADSKLSDVPPVDVKLVDKTAHIKPADIKRSPARRTLLRVGLPIAAALVVAVGLFFIYTLVLRKPGPLDDKQLLETYYGKPTFFTVIFAKDESQSSSKPVRREVWVYPDRNVSFVFLGGKYQFSSDLQAVSKSATRVTNKLRLEQITESLTVDDLSKLVGSKPVNEAALSKEDLPEAIRYDYGNGINAVFSQGRLLMVRALPFPESK